MKSPEQQPTSEEPEKKPEDIGLDIDAAKKYLEEAYGPEKSTVIVDKSIPIKNKPIEKAVEEKEKTELPPPPKKVDVEKMKKEVDEAKERQKERGLATESAEKKSTIDELKERIKKEKARIAAQIETAKNELIDLAKSINEAKEKKETKTEISLYNKAKEVFEVATGKSLEKTVKEKAKIEAESEGLRIITPEEYRKEKTTETQERVRQKERSEIIKERWDILSAQEKEKYFGAAKDKNNPDAIKSAINNFATELNKKINEKREELAKGKKSISISEDVFYELMKKGLKSEDIKKGGFFSKGGIEIPPLDKTDKRGPLRMTKEYLAEMEFKVKKNIEEVAKEEIERKIVEGQRRWREKKQRHTREIIQETAGKYETEKKLKVKPEKEPRPEITEELKPFEKVSDIEKVMKKVEADVKAKKEQQKRMQELKKKMKQGKPLTLKEKAFLNKIDSAYRKEAEK